tara:strand:- start:864 stop:1346 length:483 start_codon:yes stop_codon:yes gene_type:complete
MGTTNFKGITYTYASGASAVTGILDLDMRTGADVDQTRWLDGAGGAADAYPGSLTPFSATNNDATNSAGGSLRMLVFDVTCNSTGTVTLSSTTITDSDSDGEDDNGVVIGGAISRIIAVTGAVSQVADNMITAAINGSNSLQLDLNAEASGDYTITLLVE